MRIPPKPILERLLERRVILINDCWGWSGGTQNGYAILNIDNKSKLVARLFYSLLVVSCDGRELNRTCEDKFCINPNHSKLGRVSGVPNKVIVSRPISNMSERYSDE
jgi:hypothetical protein